MSKITAEHLSRSAYVYIRQSTTDQLLHNHESRRRQYALAERARGLGWSDVVVIDDDLGVSGSGGLPGPGLSACSPPSAAAPWAPSCRLKPLGWPVMAAIGIRYWTSVHWSAA